MLRSILLCLALASCATVASAHEIMPAFLRIAPAEGGVEITLELNLEAALAGIGDGHDDTDAAPEAAIYDRYRLLPPDALADELERQGLDAFRLQAGGADLTAERVAVEVPEVGDTEFARSSILTYRVATDAQPGAQLAWLNESGPVILNVDDAAGAEVHSEYLLTGAVSGEFAMPVGGSAGGLLQTIRQALSASAAQLAFVVGLVLLDPRLRPVLGQLALLVSLQLLAARFGPSATGAVVPALMGLSIAYIGLENLILRRVHWWRWPVVALFGVLAGLWLAGDAAPLTLTLGALVLQVGVALALLGLLAAALRDRDWYRRGIVVPGSLVIAAFGLYRFVEHAILT
ncbi:hypothetical protein [Roseobacter sp. HKCCA0434]|uniref:hypothetical protein n=1 Tax=Roseobacter sp. HKCCA0434 TaxID=3079297 RepID=UPI0029059D31|nr:hypothetical protein [Roseobacter sp. HKCCA0434]